MLFSPGWRAPIRQDEILAVFTFGLLAGGTLSAMAIWLLSGLPAPLPPPIRTGAILVVAVLGAARELGLVNIPLPQNARQIPQDVLQSRLRRGSLQFGFELGTGVRTYVSSSAPYVLALALLLAHGTLRTALAAGAAFGAGRALSAVLTYVSRDPDRAAAITPRMRPIKIATAFATISALAFLLL